MSVTPTSTFCSFVRNGVAPSDFPNSFGDDRVANKEKNNWFGRMVATALGTLASIVIAIKAAALVAMGGLIASFLGAAILAASAFFGLVLFNRTADASNVHSAWRQVHNDQVEIEKAREEALKSFAKV